MKDVMGIIYTGENDARLRELTIIRAIAALPVTCCDIGNSLPSDFEARFLGQLTSLHVSKTPPDFSLLHPFLQACTLML